MTDMVGERLRLIASGWSRRRDEAYERLDEAEREMRVAWEAYDKYEQERLTAQNGAKHG